MQPIRPNLFFNGNCREAINFFKNCLDGEIEIIQTNGESPIEFPAEPSERIFYSELVADEARIMASDVPKDI